MTVLETETAEFSCQLKDDSIEGEPKWWFHGKEVEASDKFVFHKDNEGVFRLTINDCQMDDAGEVKFTYGFVDTKARLTVDINEEWRASMRGSMLREKIEDLFVPPPVTIVLFCFLAKPEIVRESSNLKTKTIKEGHSHTFDAEIIGKPITEKIWRKEDGEPLVNNDKITIVNEDFHTTITLTNCVRSDTARYRIRVENEHGYDTERAELIVLSKPGKPMGPLEVSNVLANSCKLSWKPPEDDGGCPIIDYDVELLCPHTKQWKKIGKTPGKSLHPSFQVTDLEEGQEYLFRVTAKSDEGQSEPLVADTAIKAKNPFGPPEPPQNVQLCDWDADRMDIDWKFPPSDGGAAIQHYIVEMRKADPGAPEDNWEEVGKSDGPKRFFSMGGLTKGKKYQFRVKAVNKGGVSGPSDPTPVLTARPRKLAPKINRDQVYKGQGLVQGWKISQPPQR